jgi:hypothetical protein
LAVTKGFVSVRDSTSSNRRRQTYVRDFISFLVRERCAWRGGAGQLGISTADADAGLARIQASARDRGDQRLSNRNRCPFEYRWIEQFGAVDQGRARVAQLGEDAFSLRLDGRVSDSVNAYVRYQRNTGQLNSPDGLTGRLLVADQQPDNLVASVSNFGPGLRSTSAKFGMNRAPSTLVERPFPSVANSTIDFAKSAYHPDGWHRPARESTAVRRPGFEPGVVYDPAVVGRQRSRSSRFSPVELQLSSTASAIDPWAVHAGQGRLSRRVC